MFGRDLHLFLIIIFVNLFCYAHSAIPRVVLCVDPDCSEPISEALGQVMYTPDRKNVLGFKKGTKITIYSKTKEPKGYWGAKIGNRFGYVPSAYVREVTVWKSLDMLKHEVLTNETDSTVESNRTSQLDSSTENKDESTKVNLDTVGKGSVISPSPNLIYGMSGGLSSQKVNNEPQINSELKTDNLQAVAITEGPVPSETAPEMPTVISDGNVENTTEQFEKQEELVEEVQSVDDYNDDDYDEEDEEADVTDETSSLKNELIVENLSKDGMNIDNTVPETDSVEKTTYKKNDLKHTPATLGDIVKESTVKPENIVSESNSDINQNSHDSVLQSDMGIKDKKNEGQHSHDVNEGLNDMPVETAQADEKSSFVSLKDNSTEKEDESESVSQKDENMHEYLSSDLDKPPAENHMKLENENLGTSFVSENVVPSSSSSSYSISDGISSSGSSSSSSSSTPSMKATDFDTAYEGSSVKEVNKITSDDKILTPSESQFVQQKVQDYTQYVDFTSYQDTLGITAQPNVPGTTPIQSDTTSVPVPDHETEKLTVNSETPHISATTTIGNDFHTQSYMNTPPTYVMKKSNPYTNENAETIIPEPPIPIPQNPVEVTPLPQTPEYAPKIPEYPPVVDILKGTPHEPIEVPSKIEPAPTTPVPQTDEPVNLSENENVEIKNNGFFSAVLSWVGLGPKPEEEPLNQQSDPSDYQLPQNIAPPRLDLNFQAGLDGTCKPSDGFETSCEEAVRSEETSNLWNLLMDSKATNITSSYNTFIYLVVTAVTVLLFTLGYYFIEKFRNDGPLIAKVNKLEQELLVSTKECHILKDELANTKDKLNLFETSSNDKIISTLQLELEESKKIQTELESNIDVLQQELDAATEAGLDLNRMLSEVLTQKGGSESLMESVEHLQSQLNNQQKIIDEMTTKLITKTKENQELRDELTSATEKIESLEGEMEDMRSNLNVHLKDNEDVIKDLTAKNNELQFKISHMNDAKEKEILKLKKSLGEFETKFKTTFASLKIKDEECSNLKDCIKKIKMKDSKSIDSLFEASRIKAELVQSQNESSSLKEHLKAEEDKFAKLQERFIKMEEEVNKLKQISAEAEKERVEAQTRLTVLSNYFKEKETQLQKELGLKEAMWVQKQGDELTIFEKIKSLEEEIDNYKSQNEALKKEILDQERGLKTQITTLEKKAHENWIAARQAERKLEESKQEAAQLRNKLTLMEKNVANDLESSQHPRIEEMNGGDTLSPLIHDTSSPILFPPPLPLDPNSTSFPPGFIPPPMFMPPPPGGFMPPPPFLPGDHRPPPLGRMSSPPLNNRFSPPPPDYAYDSMSTPPLSSPTRNYRSPNESERDRERFRRRTPTSPSFRSRNWEEPSSGGMSGFRPIPSERNSKRDDKGGSNLSSGHSSDSLDKSSRHSSRV